MSNTPSAPEPVTPDEFDELEAILDDLRTRGEDVPQWEFCDGFLAALVCCRTPLPEEDWLPMLLGIGEEGGTYFTDDAQRERFLHLWSRRADEVAAALDADVEQLDDERCFHPEVMDVRGAVAAMTPEERERFEQTAADSDEGAPPLPAFGQVWALGFMFAVENWPEQWAPPRDKELARWLDEALEAIVILTEDDEGKPTVSPLSDDGPPSASAGRMNYFADAIWAVYDLREIWKGVGPKVEQVIRSELPGRNEPCWCGSGKKFKKCHGA